MSENDNPKAYLGDGAYAELAPGNNLVLTTSDGIRNTNTIWLDPNGLDSLLLFVARNGWDFSSSHTIRDEQS